LEICIRQASWNLSPLEPERARNIISRSQAAFSKFGWFVRVLFFVCNECYIIAIQDFNSRLMIWMLIWNTCTLARIKEAAQRAVLFISIVTNSRYKSLSQKILWASQNLKLDTQNSKLEPWNSPLDSWKYQGLRIEFRVETVNLHLTGTVQY